MKNHIHEEYREKLAALVTERDNETCVGVTPSIHFRENQVDIVLTTSYGMDNFVDFEFLSKISDLLGTKKISLEDEWHYPGCDTCDYGSSSTITVRAKEVNLK